MPDCITVSGVDGSIIDPFTAISVMMIIFVLVVLIRLNILRYRHDKQERRRLEQAQDRVGISVSRTQNYLAETEMVMKTITDKRWSALPVSWPRESRKRGKSA